MVRGGRRVVEVSEGVSLSAVVREARPDKRAFLLVHGLASNATLWDGVAEYLAEAGHSSVAVDQRGHGRSSRPDQGYDFATVSSDLSKVVEAALGRPVIVVGQSWGGNVAIEFAARHPDLVSGVVCVDGGFIRLAEAFDDRETAMEELAPPSFAGLTIEELRERARSRFTDWPDAGVEAQLANFEVDDRGRIRARLGLERHMRILGHLWEHDPDEVAGRVRVPVLVIAVDEEGEGRADRVGAFARSLMDGSVQWVDGDHDLHAQRPKEVARMLMDFAEGLDR